MLTRCICVAVAPSCLWTNTPVGESHHTKTRFRVWSWGMKHVFVHVLTLIGRRLKTGVRTSKLLKRLIERWDTNPLSGSHTTKRKTHKTWFSFHFEILVHMWKCQEVSLWKLWPARDKTIITCEKQCENILFACNIVYKVWTQLITRENHRHTFVLMIFSCKYMNVFDSLVKGK